MKTRERIGVWCLTLSAWFDAVSRWFYRRGVEDIVAATPIPLPPRLPRIDWPSDVPVIGIERETVPDLPIARDTPINVWGSGRGQA